MKDITLIIDCDEKSLDRLDLLMETIERFTHYKHEILILSNSNKISTLPYYNYDYRITELDRYKNWNFGLEIAKTEYVCFIDANMLVTEKWLDNMMKHASSDTIVTPRIFTNSLIWSSFWANMELIDCDNNETEIIFKKIASKIESKKRYDRNSWLRPWLVHRESFFENGGWITREGYPASMDIATKNYMLNHFQFKRALNAGVFLPSNISKEEELNKIALREERLVKQEEEVIEEPAIQVQPPPLDVKENVRHTEPPDSFNPTGLIENMSARPLDITEVYKMQKELVGYLYFHVPSCVSWIGYGMGQMQGYGMQQWPIDLIYYQEIIKKLLPFDTITIIECGTGGGGVPLFLYDVLTLAKWHGKIKGFKIITMDVIDNHRDFPEEIIFFQGDSTDDVIVSKVKTEMSPDDKVVVLLDSAHDKEHVLKEMEIYGKLVTTESYMVVQDTGLDINDPNKNGPFGAVIKYLEDHDDFEIDHFFDRWIITQHPFGYLRKR